MIQNKATALFWIMELLVLGGHEFQLAVGFWKPGPSGRSFYRLQHVEITLLRHFCKEEKVLFSLSVLVFYLPSLPFLLSFSWNKYKVGGKWTVTSVSWLITTTICYFICSFLWQTCIKHVSQTLCQAPGSQNLTDTEMRCLPAYCSLDSASERCAHTQPWEHRLSWK